jgi:hypothetical protein
VSAHSLACDHPGLAADYDGALLRLAVNLGE